MADFFERKDNVGTEVVTPEVFSFDENMTLGHIQERQERERVELKKKLPEYKPFENLQSSSVEHITQFKKKEDKSQAVAMARFKLFASMYLIVTLILTGFVIYNLVESALLSREIKQNNSKIKDLNKMIDRLKNNEADNDVQGVSIVLPSDLNL